ncbi:MAG: hypothetical protein JRF52_07060 [Deltaproteobacteria bacterium]|nr:hypothetical protein [Deltaproteobacteria bacterium]
MRKGGFFSLCLGGDDIKISKEAEKMPDIESLHQESDNSGKAPCPIETVFPWTSTLADFDLEPMQITILIQISLVAFIMLRP